MKRILLFLTCVLTLFGVSRAETAEFDYKTSTLSNPVTKNGIKITVAQGSGNNLGTTYYPLRLYPKNTMTFETINGVGNIEKIEFTTESGSNSAFLTGTTADTGTFNATSKTWTSSNNNTNKVIITCGPNVSSGHTRIETVVVTYTSTSGSGGDQGGGNTSSDGNIYEMVKSFSEISLDGEYIWVVKDENNDYLAMSSSSSSNKFTGVQIKSDLQGNMLVNNENVLILTATDITKEGSVVWQNGTQFLKGDSGGTNLTLENKSYSSTVTFDNDYKANIAYPITSGNARQILYNGTVFGHYASSNKNSTNYYIPYIYKLVKNTTPETVPAVPVVEYNGETLVSNESKDIPKNSILTITSEGASSIIVNYGDKKEDELTTSPFTYTIPESGDYSFKGKNSIGYSEDFTYTFTIVKDEYKAPFAKGSYDFTVDQTDANIDLGASYPEITFTCEPADVISIDATTGKVDILKDGSVTVNASWDETEDWKAGSTTFTVNVSKKVYEFGFEKSLNLTVGDEVALYEGENLPTFTTTLTDGEGIISLEGATVKALQPGAAKVNVSWGDNIYEAGNAEITVSVVEKPKEGSYQIVFKTGNNTGTMFKEGENINNDTYLTKGFEYVTSVASRNNAYPYTPEGIRIGSKDGAGSLVINLSEEGKVKATEIIINAKGNGSTSRLSLTTAFNGNNSTNGVAVGTTDYSNYTFTLNGEIIEQLSIYGFNRIMITGITVKYISDGNQTQYCEIPVFTPESGTPLYGEDTVTIDCVTDSSVIFYAINEEKPIEYKEPITFKERGDGKYTIKAWATAEGYENSTEVIASYTYKALNPLEAYDAILITDQSQIVEGGEYIIVGYNDTQKKYYAMTSLKGSYFDCTEASLSEDAKELTLTDEMSIVSLEKNGEYWTLKIDDKYIKSTFNSGNTLTLSEDITAGNQATITIGQDNKVAIVFPNVQNNSEDVGYLQFNASSPRFTCYKGSQQNPYLYRLMIPVKVEWSQDGEVINGTKHTGKHLTNNEYVVNVPEEVQESFALNVICKQNHEEQPEVVTFANEDNTDKHYTVESNKVTFNAAGEYTIVPTFEGTNYYAEPLDVTIEKMQVIVGGNIDAIKWKQDFAYGKDGYEIEGLLSFKGSSVDDEDLDVTVSIVPNTEKDFNTTTQPNVWSDKCGMTQWIWNQMVGIEKNGIENSNGIVDGYYSTPADDQKAVELNWDGTSGNVTAWFPCSGLYTLTVSSEDEDIEFVTSEGEAFTSTDINVYPNTGFVYTYDLSVTETKDDQTTSTIHIENDGMNIGGYQIKNEGNENVIIIWTGDENNKVNLANMPLYTPGIYLADINVTRSVNGAETPAAVDDDEEERGIIEGHIQNGGTLDLSALSSSTSIVLTLSLSKNGATTPDSDVTKLTVKTSPTLVDTTEVDVIGADSEAEAEYYTLQGVKVKNPEKGIYIKVSGNKAEKVLITE